jgi:DNA repair protein RadA/Sms
VSRARQEFRCRGCGAPSTRWAGRCGGCGEWNTLVEEPPAGSAAALRHGGDRRLRVVDGAAPVALSAVDLHVAGPRTTGLPELDRVLGGGLVPGSVTLVGGEPGVGKSTLLLQLLRARAEAGVPVLLVCAEESARQVRLRAERLGPLPERLYLLADTDLSCLDPAVADVGCELVVVDSIQAVREPGTSGSAGSVAQVRACAELVVSLAKETDVSVVVVGHVTKEGALAGPRLLEHVVDTVLSVEGDRHHALRIVRAVKHRFGPTGELGLFEMGESGLASVADPYRLLLGDRRPSQPGTVVLPAVEGSSPLLVEVQALVAGTASGVSGPRRQVQGLDGGRVALLLAVLERALGLSLAQRDVFGSVVGGIRVGEPAADLAVCLALMSAATGRPVPADVVAFGEVGLGGEVRQVPHAPRRLEEAARLGFRRAVVPDSCRAAPGDMRLVRVGDVGDVQDLFSA